MRLVSNVKFWKKIGLAGLALNLAAFTSPQKGDLVELNGLVNGRSEGLFRTEDENKTFVLRAGTRAQVAETKFFTDTKNYGLCLKISNASDLAPDHKCIWVYYDRNKPALTLYSGAKDNEGHNTTLDAWIKDDKKVTLIALKKESTPEKAVAAQVTREITGVIEKKPAIATKPAVAVAPAAAAAPAAVAPAAAPAKAVKEETAPAKYAKGVDEKAAIDAAVQGIIEFNKKQNQIMTPANQCPDGKCNAKIETYGTCTSKNDYLENPLAAVLNQSAFSAFFQAPQKEIISTSCINRNMTLFGGGKKLQCSASGVAQNAGAKACISSNYVQMTAKSFNLAAECFGSMNSNSAEAKRQFALSVFSLMAQESGMQMNVMSPSGAAGAGQLTNDAIIDVNGHLKGIRAQLAQSGNPNCSQILTKVFEKPMTSGKVCDRIGIHQDNPLKNIAYTFAYQGIVNSSLESAFFNSKTYDDIFKGLPNGEAARLKYSLVSWGHNTGPAGLKTPLAALLRAYVRKGKTLTTAADVDQLLKDLGSFNRTNPHPANRRRTKETSGYYSNIQDKLSKITSEPRSCLVN